MENKILNAPHYPKELIDQARQDYANHLELLDFQVKRIIDRLQFRLDYSNTSITMCSDHGELLGDWGLFAKSCFLEGAIRSLFVHKPARARQGLMHLRKYEKRPIGLTEALWSAFYSIIDPSRGSFGSILRSNDKTVQIEFEDEIMLIR